MLIGSGFSSPVHTTGGGVSHSASTAPVKPASTPDWSRTAPQAPLARESIHQMMSLMKDPEVSGLLALMKADEDAANAGYDAIVSAYGDNA